MQCDARTKDHTGVHIVPASMHHAGHGTAIAGLAHFLDGQGIEVRAERETALGRCGLTLHHCDDTGTRRIRSELPHSLAGGDAFPA